MIFSVIIPTFNRPDQLRRCLHALSHQDWPGNSYEVVVVDDGGNAELESVIGAFDNRMDITFIQRKKAGPAAARNAGAERARGRYLAFTDDDCRPAPDWLSRLAACFSKYPDCMITGRTINILAENRYSEAGQILISWLYAYYNAHTERARFVTSNNMALSKSGFVEIGGFDTNFPRAAGEDRELCDRWRHKGFQVVYTPDAVIRHAHDLTFGTFLMQHFNYGCAAFRFQQLRAGRQQKRMRVESPAFYLDLIRYPLRRGWDRKAVETMVLIGLSQLANAAGFFSQFILNSRNVTRERSDL